MKKVLGLGNALVDIMTRLDHDRYLPEFGLPKGSMILVDARKSTRIVEETGHLQKTVSSGGSAANTIHGLANMGVETGFIGKIGNDSMGKVFREDMLRAGIKPHLNFSRSETGRAVALISPDTERTFATFLGAAVELNEQDLSGQLFSAYHLFHIEGYIVQNHSLLESALRLASESGLKISLDLASYNVVDENRDFLTEMLAKYVNIVFANEDEARSLTGKEPEEALDQLVGYCDIAVVKVGKEGSLVGGRQLVLRAKPEGSAACHEGEARSIGGQRYKIGVIPVKSIDTTGAGDLYASGFLYGLIHDYDLEKCGRIGAILAGKVIENIGPKIGNEGWKVVRRMVEAV